MQRRNFFKLIGASAVTAIAEAHEGLIPEAASPTIITPSMIARELIFQLEHYRCPAAESVIEGFPKLGDKARLRTPSSDQWIVVSRRKHVSWLFSSADLTLSIDEYAERYLKPAAIALSNVLRDEPGNPVFASLAMPDWATFKARADWRGYCVRILRDYDYTEEDVIIRADILYGLEG